MQSHSEQLQNRVRLYGTLFFWLALMLAVAIVATISMWFIRYEDGRYDAIKEVNRTESIAFLTEDGYIRSIDGNPVMSRDGTSEAQYVTFEYSDSSYYGVPLVSVVPSGIDLGRLWDVLLVRNIAYADAALLYNNLLELEAIEPLKPGFGRDNLQDYVMEAAAVFISSAINEGSVPFPIVAPTGNETIVTGTDALLDSYRSGLSAFDIVSATLSSEDELIDAEFSYDCRTVELATSNEAALRASIGQLLTGVSPDIFEFNILEGVPLQTEEPCGIDFTVASKVPGPGPIVPPEHYVPPAPPQADQAP